MKQIVILFNFSNNMSLETSHITGVMVEYFFHCKRQLWLFSHHIQMEQESDAVLIGKTISENSYKREKHEIQIDDTIAIDFLDLKDGVLHEIKKSDSFEETHIWQVLYYLYFLKQKGVEGIIGEIDYPKLKQKTKVELTKEKEIELEKIIDDINKLISQEKPPAIEVKKSICKKCSYYELCYS